MLCWRVGDLDAVAEGDTLDDFGRLVLSGVASDVFGVSGMAMLQALAAGTTNATEMVGLACGRMRRKHAALEATLDGRMREHQCFLLGMQLRSLEAIDRDLDALDARIKA